MPPHTQPATPILASTLLENLLRRQRWQRQRRRRREGGGDADDEEEDAHGRGGADDGADSDGNRLRTGFEELDGYVLQGGVERGVVVGVSCDDGGGEGGGVGRLIALHLLATALLSNPDAKASVIDTTGSFPVSLLARIIRQRAQSHLGQIKHTGIFMDNMSDLEQKVQEILGRVAISRVFDIEGVWEVLSEMSTDCSLPISSQSASNPVVKEAAQSNAIKTPETRVLGGTTTAGPGLVVESESESEKELEVGDSEAEEDDFDLDDELEEVDDIVEETISIPHSAGVSASNEAGPSVNERLSEARERTEIIIIDNMTTPINELFSRREKNFAHTLLTTFTRMLRSLSQTHNILTILLNSLTKPPSAKSHDTSSTRKPGVSVFTLTTARPALGRVFTDMLALHIFVTTVPRTIKDAKILHGSPPLSPQPQGDADKVIQYAYIIEILKDITPDPDFWLTPKAKGKGRKVNRSQRWAPFDISQDGLALETAFGLRKPASALGQSHIAKQFPFGRRV